MQSIDIMIPNSLEKSYLTKDSRLAKPGSIFVAVKGSAFNGEDFIDDAINHGAKYIILSKNTNVREKKGIIYYYVDNPRKYFSMLANKIYQPQPDNIVAITGTNGKTSVAYFYLQLCKQAGLHSAAIGTLGVITDTTIPDVKDNNDITLTSPDAIVINSTLHTLYNKAVTHVAIEASSHGLHQQRLSGIQLKAAGFTNLSRDHLDYHKNYREYFEAKLILFNEILATHGIAVLNADIPEYNELQDICKNRGIQIYSYGKNGENIRLLQHGEFLDLEIFGTKYQIKFNLLGNYQIYNILCAIGLAIATEVSTYSIISAVASLLPATGRLEKVVEFNGGMVYVDYAHTPDGLKNVLGALRDQLKGKLCLIFGCGGNRDKGKRPIMGNIAKDLADLVIITDDNPRNENPASIRQDIMHGCPNAIEIADRKEAICYAMSLLRSGDVLLIAGKGHENMQIIGNQSLYFSDQKTVISYATGSINTKHTSDSSG